MVGFHHYDKMQLLSKCVPVFLTELVWLYQTVLTILATSAEKIWLKGAWNTKTSCLCEESMELVHILFD